MTILANITKKWLQTTALKVHHFVLHHLFPLIQSSEGRQQGSSGLIEHLLQIPIAGRYPREIQEFGVFWSQRGWWEWKCRSRFCREADWRTAFPPTHNLPSRPVNLWVVLDQPGKTQQERMRGRVDQIKNRLKKNLVWCLIMVSWMGCVRWVIWYNWHPSRVFTSSSLGRGNRFRPNLLSNRQSINSHLLPNPPTLEERALGRKTPA